MTVNMDVKSLNLSQPIALGDGGVMVQGVEKKPDFEVTDADVNQVGKAPVAGNDQELLGMTPPPKGAGKASDASKVTSQIDWNNDSFDLSSLMGKLFELNKKMRSANLDARNTELNMQVNSLMGQVKDIKDAAAKTYTANLIQGWVSIGSGAVSAVTSTVGLAKSYGATKDLKDFKTQADQQNKQLTASKDTANEPQVGAGYKADTKVTGNQMNVLGKKIDHATNITQASSAAGTSIGSVAGGAGSVAAAGTNKEAADLEAEGKKKEAEATKVAAELQKTNEYAQNAKEQMKGILDLIQAMANAEKSVQDTVIKNMV
jgi:hypothetical protein